MNYFLEVGTNKTKHFVPDALRNNNLQRLTATSLGMENCFSTLNSEASWLSGGTEFSFGISTDIVSHKTRNKNEENQPSLSRRVCY